MVVVAKKNEAGEWASTRTCHDFRRLNSATVREEHSLHHADDLFQWVGGKRIYTKLHLRSGFYQMGIAEEDRDKTAFWCNRKLYRFVRMTFGLKNAPIFFQRAVDSSLAANGCTDCARAFIDDIIITSDTPEQHALDVQCVLTALHSHGLMVHPHKSVFGAECVEYLGHNISSYGHSPNEAKVAAITKMPAPTCVSELRSVHGMLSYYRCYCRAFWAISAPLTALTKKGARWGWGPEQQAALDTLKAAARPAVRCAPSIITSPSSCTQTSRNEASGRLLVSAMTMATNTCVRAYPAPSTAWSRSMKPPRVRCRLPCGRSRRAAPSCLVSTSP